MAKLIALVALFALIAVACAAPVEEQPKKSDDLQAAQGIGFGYYGYPFFGHGLYGGYGLGYGFGGLGYGYGHGFGYKGFGGFYG